MSWPSGTIRRMSPKGQRCRICRAPLVGTTEQHGGFCYVHRRNPNALTSTQAKKRRQKDPGYEGIPPITDPTPQQLATVERFRIEVRHLLRARWNKGHEALLRRAPEIGSSIAKQLGDRVELSAVLDGLGYDRRDPRAAVVREEITRMRQAFPPARIIGGGLARPR